VAPSGQVLMNSHENSNPAASSAAVSRTSLVVVVAVAVAMTVVFWLDLWRGGGLIGGDIYTYFFPQKAYFADRLHDGEFPLWNNRVGHGYPLVGESQTGAFYPFHVLYALFDVNTAYNAVQLSHYVLAFVFTWLYARRIGLGNVAAMLAAVVYVYGWFPPRICLEWAIIGGTWLPAALWAVESHLLNPARRWPVLLSLVLAVQLLAGHFHLAFITQLVLAVYIPSRLFVATRGLSEQTVSGRRRQLVVLAAAVFLGLGLAAAQLVPTWELKQHSQRESVVGRKYEPGYGHMPVRYWMQVVAPWKWYDKYEDHVSRFPGGPAATNQIEAHLYFGLATVGLLMIGGIGFVVRGRVDGRLVLWLVMGLLALGYTPGWHVGFTSHLPGFGFFTGPGRYGIVTTLAAAILGAAALEWLLSRRLMQMQGGLRLILLLLLFPLLAWDLWEVSRQQTYAIILEGSLLERVSESRVYKIVSKPSPQPVRLFCRYQNLPTLFGVAATPVYLGIGPAEYFDPRTIMPGTNPHEPATPAQVKTPDQVDWLRRAGVTHVVSLAPLDPDLWPVRLLDKGPDPRFLQVAFYGHSQFHVYQLLGTRGRLAWLDAPDDATARITEHRGNRVRAEVSSPQPGRIVLTDLAYPGWEVSIDGKAAETIVVDGVYRGVDVSAGEHRLEWVYRPTSLWVGAGISLVSLLVLAGGVVLSRRRHE